jgi:hypothetical protein
MGNSHSINQILISENHSRDRRHFSRRRGPTSPDTKPFTRSSTRNAVEITHRRRSGLSRVTGGRITDTHYEAPAGEIWLTFRLRGRLIDLTLGQRQGFRGEGRGQGFYGLKLP